MANNYVPAYRGRPERPAPPPPPLPEKTGRNEAPVRRNLSRFSFDPQKQNTIINALAFLERAGLLGAHNRYLKRLSGPVGHEVAGVVGELSVIPQLAVTAQILDANIECAGPNGARIEFFDIVARDKATGQLLLVEVKTAREYTLGDLAHQLLGIGNEWGNSQRKDVCQMDVLLHPERYTLASKYQKDIEAGNFEIRVITSRRRPDFERFYGTLKNLSYLLEQILASPDNAISSQKRFTLSKEQIMRLIQNTKDRIAREKPVLAGIGIRFNWL